EKKDETPAWQKREITIERNKRRAADEARVAAETRAERAEKAAARALELAEKVAAGTAKADAANAADVRPKRDAFDNPDKYDEALEAWMTRAAERAATTALDRQKAEDAKADAERLKTEADKAREEETRGRAIVFQEKATKFKEQAQDFDDLVMRAPDEGGPVITHQMSGAMLEADNGPEIAYHLAKNVEESQRIANLTPARQVYEIGRLSARLENEAA